MDFLTYSKIRAYCWQDVGPHIDTPDRETLRRMRVKLEGGRRGDISHEAIQAKWLVEATGYLKPREHAAAVVLANISNLYLETADLPRTGNNPPPLGKVDAAALVQQTRDAVTGYAAFLPEPERAVLLADCEAAPVLPAGGIRKGPHQGIPIKSRYTIAEAKQFIANATGETVTQSQILDWGSQGLYRLYAPLKWTPVRQAGKTDIERIRDSIVEIRLSNGQAATLGTGKRVDLATCWRDGIECNFMRQKGEYSPGWRIGPVSFSAAGLVLLGAELAAFTASISKPQQTAPATDTAPAQNTATPGPVVPVGDGPEKPRSNKSDKTLIFEAKVLELLGKCWNDRTPGTEPTKGDLCKSVYAEILRTPVRGPRKTTLSMVNDVAKGWSMPIVLPAFVPESKFNDKRHPFKGEK